MPAVDVVDSTWIGLPAPTVAPVVADPARWATWWPTLALTVDEARGPKGVRWRVHSVADDGGLGLHGTAEVWLQPEHEGVVAHFFLRLDAARAQEVPRRVAEALVDRYRRRAKRAFWETADSLDTARAARLTG